jgi:hypothetical protein
MNGTAARQEAKKILAELPDRISDVIKPFVRHNHNTTIVLGGIIHAHVDPSVWRNSRVDAKLLNPVCRLSGSGNAALRDLRWRLGRRS